MRIEKKTLNDALRGLGKVVCQDRADRIGGRGDERT